MAEGAANDFARMVQTEAAANDDMVGATSAPVQADAEQPGIEPTDAAATASGLTPPPAPRPHVKPQGPLVRLVEPSDVDTAPTDANADAPTTPSPEAPEIVRERLPEVALDQIVAETEATAVTAPETPVPPVRPVETAPPPIVAAASPAKALNVEEPSAQPVEPALAAKGTDAPLVRPVDDASAPTTTPATPLAPAPLSERPQASIKQADGVLKSIAAISPDVRPAPVAEALVEAPDQATSAANAAQTAPKPAEAAPVQAVALAPHAPAAAAPAPEARIEPAAPRVDAPSTPQISRATIETTTHIAAQILKTLDGRSSRFEMALRPEDLGRVDVSLDIDADGQLSARLAFDNPLAATDLKGRADELRRQLEAFGFKLNDDALDFAQRDDSSSAFDRGASSQDREGRSNRNLSASRLTVEAAAPAAARWQSFNATPDRVDLRI